MSMSGTNLDDLPEDVQDTILERASGRAGLRQLAQMIGLQSVKEGTDYEADARQRELDTIECEMYGRDPKQKKQGEDAVRDILATGDVYIGKSDEQRQPTKKPSGIGKIATLGLAALGLGAGLSLPVIAWNLTRSKESKEIIEYGAKFVPVPVENDQ